MNRLIIASAAALLSIAMPLASQESASASEFKEALQELLEEGDWSPEEIRELTSVEVDWNQAGLRDCETVAVCLQYAREEDGTAGPEALARIALEVAMTTRQMRALGFGEPQIVRTSLNGTREALADLRKLRERERVYGGTNPEIGLLIRNRFEEQVHSALRLEARQVVRRRVQEEKNSRPDHLLVPPGPRGPAGPGR